jgi:hypothetical protein
MKKLILIVLSLSLILMAFTGSGIKPGNSISGTNNGASYSIRYQSLPNSGSGMFIRTFVTNIDSLKLITLPKIEVSWADNKTSFPYTYEIDSAGITKTDTITMTIYAYWDETVKGIPLDTILLLGGKGIVNIQPNYKVPFWYITLQLKSEKYDRNLYGYLNIPENDLDAATFK